MERELYFNFEIVNSIILLKLISESKRYSILKLISVAKIKKTCSNDA